MSPFVSLVGFGDGFFISVGRVGFDLGVSVVYHCDKRGVVEFDGGFNGNCAVFGCGCDELELSYVESLNCGVIGVLCFELFELFEIGVRAFGGRGNVKSQVLGGCRNLCVYLSGKVGAGRFFFGRYGYVYGLIVFGKIPHLYCKTDYLVNRGFDVLAYYARFVIEENHAVLVRAVYAGNFVFAVNDNFDRRVDVERYKRHSLVFFLVFIVIVRGSVTRDKS